MRDLPPGANAPLPGATATVLLDGPFDLSAMVLGADGKVAGDDDFVFYNSPTAPGVQVGPGRVRVVPDELRRGAERVVVVASGAEPGTRFGSLPQPSSTVVSDGRPFARLEAPPTLRLETALLVAEIYWRGGWRLRSVGQGYADGLAGLARDFGVDVDDDGTGGPTSAPAPAEPPAKRDPVAPPPVPVPHPAPTPQATPAPQPGQLPPPGNPPTVSASNLVAAVVNATNAERWKRGMPVLGVDPRLERAAYAHSADMVRRGFFAHQSPDGAQVWDRALAHGYGYWKIAENIAAGQRTADEVVQAWMTSPGHRANILDAGLTQIGVGHAVGGQFGTYWTQVFGTPR